MSVCWV